MTTAQVLQWTSFIFFALAGIIHFAFFIYQSFWMQRSSTLDRAVRLWAFNQGFYNLALAIGTFVSLSFVLQKKIMQAGLLMSFCGFTMILAGVVLWFSAPHLRKGALLQMLPPLIGFVFLFFHVAGHL